MIKILHSNVQVSEISPAFFSWRARKASPARRFVRSSAINTGEREPSKFVQGVFFSIFLFSKTLAFVRLLANLTKMGQGGAGREAGASADTADSTSSFLGGGGGGLLMIMLIMLIMLIIMLIMLIIIII